MATLTQAFTQWNSRPADQRFSSLDDLHRATSRYHQEAGTATVPFSALHAIARDGRVMLNGRTETTADLTHWSFGQLAQRAGAPPSYLRQLPAELAAECVDAGLAKRASSADDDGNASLLFTRNGSLACRAITTDKYTRIWNSDISGRLLKLAEAGPWQPAPAAFDGSRGLYAGDEDMFCFMVDSERRIFETLPGGGLSRGFFVWNSEVGAASFGVMTFLYEYVCGNHRVWGAQGIAELRIRHVGRADERAFRDLTVELRRYSEQSGELVEQNIARARAHQLGATKDEVLDAVFALRLPQLSMSRLGEAYKLAEARESWYGSPRTAWGLAGGLTEMARDLPNASDRVALDRAAGKVMAVAF